MGHHRYWRTAALAALVGIGCAGPVWAAEEILVSAAASLANALADVGRAFEAGRPGFRVVMNFAASGSLLQQLAHGAPVDVFASADQQTMDAAEEKGLLHPGSRRNFARNRLVVAVPRGAAARLDSLADLAGAGVLRVSLGDPAYVPAGRYARQSLEAHGLWAELAPRLILANSVRQVLDYVGRREVDAGFVYATDVAVAGARTTVALVADRHDPVLYPVAVVASSKREARAREFVAFLVGPSGAEVLSRQGFLPP